MVKGVHRNARAACFVNKGVVGAFGGLPTQFFVYFGAGVQVAVPAFPNAGCALTYHIAKAGETFLESKFQRKVVVTQHSQNAQHLVYPIYPTGKAVVIPLNCFVVPQNRGGKGVKCYKIMDKTGYVIGAKAVNLDNEIMLITNEGIIIRMAVSDISILGRITSGVKLIDIDVEKDIRVASLTKVKEAVPIKAAEVNENVSKGVEVSEVINEDIVEAEK